MERLAGVTGALAAAASFSPTVFAAEKPRDERRPMPHLGGASPNHPELPVSACRLWQLALMLHAAGVGAFGTRALQGTLATEHGRDNRGLRGNLARDLLGELPLVNQTIVCPPPFFLAGFAGCRSRMPVGLFPSCGFMLENDAGFRPREGEPLAAGGSAAPPQLHQGSCHQESRNARNEARIGENRVCAHSSLAATGRRARVPPHTVTFPPAL